MQLDTAAAIPLLAGLRAAPGPPVPLVFATPAGAALNVPFSVLEKPGQDHLPTRPGTAAGVTTLGLAVSVGGLIAPLFGLFLVEPGPEA